MTAVFAALPGAVNTVTKFASSFSGGTPHGPDSPAVLQAAGSFIQTVRNQLLTTGRSPAGEYELGLSCGSASSPYSCNRLQQAVISTYQALGVPLPTALVPPPVLTPGVPAGASALALPLASVAGPSVIGAPSANQFLVLILIRALIAQILGGLR